MGIVIIAGIILLSAILFYHLGKRDSRGFDKKGIHKNGTKYDDFGYDVKGYDCEGYNCSGYDIEGYDRKGYNQNGYNRAGRNNKGQYNRLFDIQIYKTSAYSKDGFLNPRYYPISVTNHARQRIIERMPSRKAIAAEQLALDAYSFGKSKRQIKRSSAVRVEEIENRYDGSIVLIHHGYIYIFSEDNKLITVYENERIYL